MDASAATTYSTFGHWQITVVVKNFCNIWNTIFFAITVQSCMLHKNL